MKLGTYKEDGYVTTYYENGTVWSCMQNPLYPIKNWDELPEGISFQNLITKMCFQIVKWR